MADLIPEQPPVVPEADFRLYLRDLLRDGDVPVDVRELAEDLQMKMATFGDWEAAKYQAPDQPPETKS